MQQIDCIVVGLGIAGTLVSYELWRAGVSFVVIDDPQPPKCSLVAGAVINPVNIKQWKPVTHSDVYLPVALETYQHLAELLGCRLLHQKPMLVHTSINDSAFNQLSSFATIPTEAQQQHLNATFKGENNFLKIANVWQVDAGLLYQQWRQFLIQKNLLLEEKLKPGDCEIQQNNISYKSIRTKKIIYCEGASGAANPVFSKLPFTRNRGEALLLSIHGLDPGYIYQNTTRLVPAGNNIFWCGSNYTWEYHNLLPDERWRAQTTELLNDWLKIPFTVLDHIVAERPTTAGQFPMVGIHPEYPSIAILNGLGTKGFSMGPILAQQIVQLITATTGSDLSAMIKPLHQWLH